MASKAFQFNGDRSDYVHFWNEFTAKLSELGIYYVVDEVIRVITLGQPPEFPAEVPILNPENPEYNNAAHREYLQQVSTYNTAYSQYVKNRDKYQVHCSQAIGVLLTFLSPNIKTEVHGIRGSRQFYSMEEQLNACLNFLTEKYGPENQIDASRVEDQINKLDDSKGVNYLVTRFKELQNELALIHEKDNEGQDIYDENGNAKTYKWSDSRCRSFFLSKLGNNGNPHFKNINQKFTMDTRLTYQQLLEDINSLLKDKSKWDFVGPTPKTQNMNTQNKNINQVSTNNRTMPSNTLLCLNCGGVNHTVDNCMSKKCFECIKKYSKMVMFPTVEARRQHDADLGHYVSTPSPSNNNNNNNNNKKRKETPSSDNDSPPKSNKKHKNNNNKKPTINKTYGKTRASTTTTSSSSKNVNFTEDDNDDQSESKSN
jgi:hypothetical protein